MAEQRTYGLTFGQMEEFIKTVKLPIGQELFDRCTYRVDPLYYLDLDQKFRKAVAYYSKVLILSDGLDHPIGGVFFDGNSTLIMYMLEEYRTFKHMSAICHNGILRSECYPYQAVRIPLDSLDSYEYFQKIHHMMLCCGLRINNLDACFEKLLSISEEVAGCYADNGYSSFVAAYGVDGAYERLAPGDPMNERLARSTSLILYDNRTQLVSNTSDCVVFDYRPAKNLIIQMRSVGSDVMLGLYAIDARVIGRGKKVIPFSPFILATDPNGYRFSFPYFLSFFESSSYSYPNSFKDFSISLSNALRLKSLEAILFKNCPCTVSAFIKS